MFSSNDRSLIHALHFHSWKGRQVPSSIRSLGEFPSDGSLGCLSSCFVIFRANKWRITAKSCRLSSSFPSSSTSAVRSYVRPPFGFGHHEGFMSFHIVTKLVSTRASHKPHSKLTCHSSWETEGSMTRSSRTTPNCNCSDVIVPICRTLSIQKLRITACTKSKYESIASSLTNGL